MTSIFLKMEDDHNIKVNGRQPQFYSKWKTTSISSIVYYLNFKVYDRRSPVKPPLLSLLELIFLWSMYKVRLFSSAEFLMAQLI